MVQHNRIAQLLDEVALWLAKLKERPSTPTLSKQIQDLCERRTNILAKLGWLPFTPVTVASQEMRSVQPLSNSVQETLLSVPVCSPGICVPTLSMHSISTGVVVVSMSGKEEVMGNQCERYDGMLSVESQLCRSSPYSRGAISTPKTGADEEPTLAPHPHLFSSCMIIMPIIMMIISD